MTKRYVLVFLLAAASLVTWLPDLRRDVGHPLGNAQVDINYKGVVVGAGPSAAAAGVKVGDRIDLAGKSPSQRYAALYPLSANPGAVVLLPLTSREGHYTARIKTAPEIPNVPVIVMRQLAALLMLILGAFLVLKRPNIATWAFFIFALNGGGPVNDFYLLGPVWWFPIGDLWSGLLTWVPPFFGAVFALHLLHDGPLPAWRRRVELAIYAVMIAAVGCGAAEVALFVYLGIDWGEGTFISTGLTLLAYLSIPAILVATYAESKPSTRERLRWVIWAFSITALAALFDFLGSQGNLGLYNTTYLEHSLLTLAYTLVPAVAVLYTVLKHRVIDVNVAISRAVVYAVLSTIIVGIFTLVDMFFSSALSASRAGLFADMALALVLGFSFNAMHARVDRFMDWLIFRARHRAEEHVATVASAIPYARTAEHVNRLLIDEPVRAFALADGVLMRVQDEGTLEFVHAARGRPGEVAGEDAESLIAILRAQRKPYRLTEHHMALAVPVFSEMELEAVAFYGTHTNGTDVDGEEIALIERAAVAAGAAYAKFHAAALRERVAELEEENAQLKAAATA
ncbi:MAG TPA: hypothetical protein VFW34_07785 [Candidatus Rubrimentiphilum sp.]|nr:hypothetical protein [Candidatus Rubrimentiphilum sp.]